MNYADSNWLVAVYVPARSDDEKQRRRQRIVDRFIRQHGGQLALSHVTLLEVSNIFRRVTGQAQPEALERLRGDFGGRVYVDAMNWDRLRAECDELFARYAHKVELGSFDSAIVAAARLGGAKRFLSFDENAKALAVADGLEVFPELSESGRDRLRALRA